MPEGRSTVGDGAIERPGRLASPAGARPARAIGPCYTPHRPGWALVGDAGLVMDPITGQGIGDAFRDAELLAGAVDAGLGGGQPLEAALAGYQRQRDRAAIPIYDFTTGLASFTPPPVEAVKLFQALEEKPGHRRPRHSRYRAGQAALRTGQGSRGHGVTPHLEAVTI